MAPPTMTHEMTQESNAQPVETSLSQRIRPAVSVIPVIAQRVARAVRVSHVPQAQPAGGEQ